MLRAVLFGAGFLALIGAARAEVLTLRCVNPPQQFDWIFDIDLTTGAVTITAPNGTRSAQAEVSERAIELVDPFAPVIRFRIDRMTGAMWSKYGDWQWNPYGTCSRLDKQKF